MVHGLKKVINNLKYKRNIFSNTSSLKLSDIGENVNGFHFMNPISMRYIEICERNDYSKDDLYFILEKTIIGAKVRASVDDPETAKLLKINTCRYKQQHLHYNNIYARGVYSHIALGASPRDDPDQIPRS